MEFYLKDESYAILGAVFDVYRDMGCGFLEDVYQECLEIELGDREVPWLAKPKLELEYKDRVLRKWYEPDLVCYGKIIVELKASVSICDEHVAQLINYLKATGMKVGYVVTFGSYPKAEYRRVVV